MPEARSALDDVEELADVRDVSDFGDRAVALASALREQMHRDRATARALVDYLHARAAERPSTPAPVLVADPSPATAGEARGYARRRCLELDVEPDRRDALVLAASELVGNAVRHGSPPLAYAVTTDRDDLLLTVSDGDATPPVADGCGGHDAESGRGLFLIGEMARGWGWYRYGSGKTVWVRV